MVKKAWKALRRNGNSDTKRLAYTSLVCHILEYGAAYWDPYRERQINALDWVQNRAVKFAHHRNDSNWETLMQCRNVACICILSKMDTGKWAWKTIGGMTYLGVPSVGTVFSVVLFCN
jgi:uncharacterized cysteine cluster protein YcgN (CxxCxxCC family)